MICSSGISVVMSTTLQQIFSWDIFSPIISLLLDFSSLLLVWLFFTGTYMLVPNTKVKFKNAFVAGILAGTAFMILQWLFVSGQIYVTKYNAIYGSFAFLPLLLIWMQLVWLITLSGAVYCYSSQNIFEFSFSNQTERISEGYRWRITVAVMAISVNRFLKQQEPMNDHEISEAYGLPISLVTGSINALVSTGLLMRVVAKSSNEDFAVAPAINPSTITLGELLRRLANKGSSGFIPGFDERFVAVNSAFDNLGKITLENADDILISSLDINDLNHK
jgi:membrane protein